MPAHVVKVAEQPSNNSLHLKLALTRWLYPKQKILELAKAKKLWSWLYALQISLHELAVCIINDENKLCLDLFC